MTDWFAMGGYAAYVWPAYGVAAVVMGWLAVSSLMRYRSGRRELDRLQAGRRKTTP